MGLFIRGIYCAAAEGRRRATYDPRKQPLSFQKNDEHITPDFPGEITILSAGKPILMKI